MAEVSSEAQIPEPEKTGVDPTQSSAPAQLVLVPPDSADKAYGSMKDVLGAHYGSGIGRTAIPIFQFYEERSEQRFREVDQERRQALERVDQLTRENTDKTVLITKYRERLKGGYPIRIAEQIMTTLGAAALGAGLSDALSTQPHVAGKLFAILGAVLLICGWGLALNALLRHYRDTN